MVVVATSPSTPIYNCIAWAASDTNNWWWPTLNGFWPANVPRELTLEAFELAYNTLGYSRCDNENLESGYEKIAIYVDNNNIPQHAARQLQNGTWTSKLGKNIDVEHDLHELRQHVLDLSRNQQKPTDYGVVRLILKRSLGPA